MTDHIVCSVFVWASLQILYKHTHLYIIHVCIVVTCVYYINLYAIDTLQHDAHFVPNKAHQWVWPMGVANGCTFVTTCNPS